MAAAEGRTDWNQLPADFGGRTQAGQATAAAAAGYDTIGEHVRAGQAATAAAGRRNGRPRGSKDKKPRATGSGLKRRSAASGSLKTKKLAGNPD